MQERPSLKAPRHSVASPGRRSPLPAARCAVLLVLCSLSFIAAVQDQAPRPVEPEKMWALVIGVSNYTRAEPLKFAASDAQAFSDFLQSPRGGGIPREHVSTLVEDQATRTGVLLELGALQEKVQKGDTVYLYLAGHGIMSGRSGYFIPSDGDPRSAVASAVPFVQLKSMIEADLAHAKNRIVITDICHAGRIGAKPEALAAKIQNLINEEFQNLRGAGGGFLNLFASRPSESSWEREDLGHGVFTHALLEALNGKAVGPGEAVADARRVVDFVRAEVPKYTAGQQHPVANDDFDPTLPLSFPGRPGPAPKAGPEEAFLEITNADKAGLVRVQWTDPGTQSTAVRQIPRDSGVTRIGPLMPGDLELGFFDAGGQTHRVKVKLAAGKNALDLAGTKLNLKPGPPAGVELASLTPFLPAARARRAFAPPSLPPPPEAGDATLSMRLDNPAQIYVDETFYGESGAGRTVQLEGLVSGPHTLRLVQSPEREQRFRLKLFSGQQVFDPPSGELRFVRDLHARALEITPPADLPAPEHDLYRSFHLALREEHLVTPAGNSAWDYYSRLRPSVPAAIGDQLKNRLIVAMGDHAQRTILKYLRGGDTRWRAEVFEEGALLIDRVRQLFKTTPLFESQQSFFQGRALIERGQYAQAVQELQRCVALDPEASHALNAIGLAYWKQNLLDRAIPSLQQAITLSPQWAYPRNTLALIYLEQRRYSDSERMFQTSIEADQEDSAAYRGLGQLYLLLGRLEDAEPQIQHAIEFNPGNAYAYETLGRLRQYQRRYGEAEQAYRLAIRLEPDEASFQTSLAELLAQANRPLEAEPIFRRLAGAGGANSFEAVQAYTRFLSDQRRYSDAEALYEQALKSSPGDANLLVVYGEFLLERGRPRDAEKPLRRARQIAPDNAFVHYALALLSLGQKNPAEAEKEISLSSKADPRLAAPYQLLGEIRLAQKRLAEALAAYRKAFELTIDANQRQKLQEQIGTAETAFIQQEIGRAERLASDGKKREAWAAYAAALASAPDSRELRDSILQFYPRASSEADLSKLPPAAISDVLKTRFWSRQQQAEEMWQKGQRDQAVRTFVMAFDETSAIELRALDSTAFNLGNESHGLHQIIYRWCLRMLEGKDCAGALELAGSAVRRMVFAVVPDYRPLTVDSLMSRPDVAEPKTIADYNIAHHPDRRAHEIFAAALAGSGKMETAKQYLVALEQDHPDLPARLLVARTLLAVERRDDAASVLKECLRDPKLYDRSAPLAEVYVRLAEIQCGAGDCPAGRRTLEEGQKVLPGDKSIEEALRKTKP